MTTPIFKHLEPSLFNVKTLSHFKELLGKNFLGEFHHDAQSISHLHTDVLALLNELPIKSKRSQKQLLAAKEIFECWRDHKENFLNAHALYLYQTVTHDLKRFLRLDQLLHEVQNHVPGLTPSPQTLSEERERIQRDKEGHEIDQGLFLSHVLADEICGIHLCHAMLLEHPKTEIYKEEYFAKGQLTLDGVSLKRENAAACLTFQNGPHLHAEDDTTLDHTEICADLAILDPQTSIALMRGEVIEEGKYKGKRVFCSGINLTRLYNGKIPYLFYIDRDMGIVNKIYRGIASKNRTPIEYLGETVEKLWIAAIEQFAIGGGCQYILVTDVNLAATNAYMTLPARKEGIIPGVANLRLPRFVGDRISRQAIMMERRIDCNSVEGKMICDLVVPEAEMDATIQSTIQNITTSGVVSAKGNRKSFRVIQEPLDAFRQYMAVYVKEQAYCHFSDALISNLELNWDAHNRKLKAREKPNSP